MTSAQNHLSVEILYARWQQLRADGQFISLTELCRDQPDLIHVVLQRIQQEDPGAIEELSRLTMVAETALLGKESTPELRDAPASQANPSTYSVVLKEPAAQPTRSFSPGEMTRQPRGPAPQIAGFEVLDYLGGGGMGEVYKVKKIGFNIIYALKMIRRDRTSTHLVERFRKEAEAMTRLDHPHIVRVFEVGVDSDQNPYLTMRLLSGGTLAHRIKEWQKDIPKSVELMRKVCSAVAYLHQRGILHRDLKPGNVLFDEHDNPYVTDFGLVKELAESPVSPEAVDTGHTPFDHVPCLTLEGAVIGTPEYMAPEARAGNHRNVGPASDVYGLGVMMNELLAGQRPAQASDPKDRVQAVGEISPAQQQNPRFDRSLQQVIVKCLSPAQTERFANAAELQKALDNWHRRQRPHRLWLWAVAGALILAVGVTAAAIFRQPTAPFVQLPPAKEPAEFLREQREQLLRGEETILIGPKGEPAWHQLQVGQNHTFFQTHWDGSWGVVANFLALVELCPNPMSDNYRIEAEIDQYGQRGLKSRVGLYFFHRTDGTHHCFADWSFTDELTPSERLKDPPVGHKSGRARFRFQSIFWNPNPAEPGLNEFSKVEDQSIELSEPVNFDSNPPFHKIAVDVTPKGLTLWYDDKKRFIGDWKKVGIRFDGLEFRNNPKPELSLRGGIGLYVSRSSARIRNLVIRPLGNP